MGRPAKQGLDYFPLDVDFLNDLKIKRIMRDCGIQSISILISLLTNVFKDKGYYLHWDNDLSFVIADELNVDENFINNVLKKALEVNFFNKEIFVKYSILTSKGIQKRYFKVLKDYKRKKSEIKFELILLDVNSEEMSFIENKFGGNPDKLGGNTSTTTVNPEETIINPELTPKRKGKEKKGKESERKGEESLKILHNEFLANGFGMPSATTIQMIESDYQDYGFEWCQHAMLIAVERNVRKWNYARKILKDWESSYDLSAKPWEVEHATRISKGNANGGNRQPAASKGSNATDWGNMPTDRW